MIFFFNGTATTGIYTTDTLFPYTTRFRSVEAVGARRPHHRAVIGVADRERLGERRMERDVGAAEIAHRIGAVDAVRAAMRGQPLVHLAAVPRLVLHRPFVAGRRDRLRGRREAVEVEE